MFVTKVSNNIFKKKRLENFEPLFFCVLTGLTVNLCHVGDEVEDFV